MLEKFEFKGKKYEAVYCDKGCLHCDIGIKVCSYNKEALPECLNIVREDKKDVVFKEIKEDKEA